MRRVRRRQKKRQGDGSFQAINITPFTDVLLVLLIIFLIAGSSLTLSGVEVDKLSASGGELESQDRLLEEHTLFVTESGGLLLLSGGRVIRAPKLTELDRMKALNLTASRSTKVELVIKVYDELLEMNFQDLRLAEPREQLSR